MLNKLWNRLGGGAPEENPALAAYQQYRQKGVALNEKLVKFSVDDAALMAAARTLGMKGPGRQLILDDEGDTAVLMDYILYELYREGQNAVARYQATVGGINSIEQDLLAAMMTATAALFRVETITRAARLIHLSDLTQKDRTLALTDIGLSQSLASGYVLFLRPIILPAFAMTSGITFPFPASLEATLLRRWQTPSQDVRAPTLAARRYATFFRLSRRQGIEMRYADPQ